MPVLGEVGLGHTTSFVTSVKYSQMWLYRHHYLSMDRPGGRMTAGKSRELSYHPSLSSCSISSLLSAATLKDKVYTGNLTAEGHVVVLKIWHFHEVRQEELRPVVHWYVVGAVLSANQLSHIGLG